MKTFFSMLFQDPVMIASAVVIAGTAAILIWSLKSLNGSSSSAEEPAFEDMPQEPASREEENSGLTEARLQAIVNQLNDISQRLSELEKAVKGAKLSDQTVPFLQPSGKIDESIKRLESKIDAIASVKIVPGAPGPAPDISALETKIEGIHKLLIYLTDSGK